MPRHRVVAGGDRNAGEALEPGGRLGHAQAGARDEDRPDPGRGREAPNRGFDRGDGDARGVAIVVELHTAPYNLRQFIAQDSDGNRFRVFFDLGGAARSTSGSA